MGDSPKTLKFDEVVMTKNAPKRPKRGYATYCKPCYVRGEFFDSVKAAKIAHGSTVTAQVGFTYLTEQEHEQQKLIDSSPRTVRATRAAPKTVYVTTEPAKTGIDAARAFPCVYNGEYYPSQLALVKKHGSAVLRSKDFARITKEQYLAHVSTNSNKQ